MQTTQPSRKCSECKHWAKEDEGRFKGQNFRECSAPVPPLPWSITRYAASVLDIVVMHTSANDGGTCPTFLRK